MTNELVSKYRKDFWKHEDEQYEAQIIDIYKRLDVNQLEVYIPELNKMVTYDDIVKNIKNKHVEAKWVYAMREFLYLISKKYRDDKELINTFLKRIVVDNKEKVEVIEALQKKAEGDEK